MKLKHSFPFLTAVILILGLGSMISCQPKKQDSYKGVPFSDDVYQAGAQRIPGKLQCEYYDTGGEGTAFHDSDSINSGSGGLNPADGTYLNEFRMDEAVDITYTKFRDPAIDNNPFNLVEPEKDQLYVGWTSPGEWTKYTVQVTQSGMYRLGIMYTSNQGGSISLDVNDMDVTGPIEIPTTYVEEDTVGMRQWHHWNYLDDMARVELEEGLHILTLHTLENGQMNYDYISFTLLQ